MLDVHFLNLQRWEDRVRLAGALVKQIAAEVERVAEAVGRVHAHHQSALAELCQANAGGRGQARLAYAAFPAEQKNAHKTMVVWRAKATVTK